MSGAAVVGMDETPLGLTMGKGIAQFIIAASIAFTITTLLSGVWWVWTALVAIPVTLLVLLLLVVAGVRK
jgi:hypothetical protein